MIKLESFFILCKKIMACYNLNDYIFNLIYVIIQLKLI